MLYKHYAKCVPTIDWAFGIFHENQCVGVCMFGRSPNYNLNDGGFFFGKDIRVPVRELNRLVVNDNLPQNTLSSFVSTCSHFLPRPLCLVSYADPNYGHHGYIYQALGWIYTGESSGESIWIAPNNTVYHRRHVHLKVGLPTEDSAAMIAMGWNKKKQAPKHRYLKFLGNKKQIREMIKHLRLPILPYPKGDNQRYDASYEPKQRKRFFT